MNNEYYIPIDPNNTKVGDELMIKKIPAPQPSAAKRLYRILVPPNAREQIYKMRMEVRSLLESPLLTVDYLGLQAKFRISSASARETTANLGYEGETLREFIEAIPKHGPCVVWDVGAAFGLYSLFAALKNPDVQVHAFEPDPNIAKSLLQNISLNGLENVKVHRFALSDTNGTSSLHTDGVAGLAPCLKNTKDFGHTIEVLTRTSDSMLSEIPSPDIMKVDTEGAEWIILKGASQMLQAENHPSDLFIEMHPTMDHYFGRVSGMEWSQILSYGYYMYSVYFRNINLLCHAVSK
jgi:FkbM family methyltransferase